MSKPERWKWRRGGEEVNIHILRVPMVVTKYRRIPKYGWGKKRAWCPKCNQLRDNKSFTMFWYWPHPANETGWYYGGHMSACCKGCAEKEKSLYVTAEEFDRMLRDARHEEVAK